MGAPSSARSIAAGILFACLLAAGLAGCGLGGGGVTPVRTPFNKGAYYYSIGDYDAAAAEYRLALEDEPDDFRARFNLGLALEAQADEASRRGDASAAESMRAKAAEQYTELLRRRPGDERASINLAAIEYERGQRAAAMQRLDSLLEADPRSVLALVARASYSLRDGQASLERLQAARELLQTAVDENPASIQANMILGDVLVRMGELDPASEAELLPLARAAYERALARDPADLATLLARARLELAAGELSAARTWLNHALFVDSEHLEARLMMAETLERQGDLRGATLNLWKARDLDDELPRVHADEVYRERLLSLYVRLAVAERSPDGAIGPDDAD